ncbi:MAG TPA: hypothetical protein VF323_06975 [Candidatus Limnocylindrales bacterium]
MHEPTATDDSASETSRRVRDLPPVTERELAAQRRGLASAYIAGGEDPDPERTRRDEARFVRLLILMIALIVGLSLIVTFVGLIVAGPAS